MLGYTDDELANDLDEWRRRIHPDDAEGVLAAQRAYLEGAAPRYVHEYRLRHKDGSYRWVLTRGTALRDEAGMAYRMVGWHTDITERREAEEQLRLQEQFFRGALFEQSPIPTVRYAPDGHILQANAAAPSSSASLPEQAPAYNLFIDEQAREHGVTDSSARLRGRGRLGTTHLFRSHALPPAGRAGQPALAAPFPLPHQEPVLCVRRSSPPMRTSPSSATPKDQLREKEEQYRSIFETTSDAIIINTLDGYVAEANPAACALHGYTYHEFIGRRGTDFIHPDSAPTFYDYLERELQGRPFVEGPRRG